MAKPSPESAMVIQMLRSQPIAEPAAPGTPIDYAAQRAGMEQFAALMPPAADIEITETTAGGVPAEFHVAPGADSSRVVLYIHGGAWVMGSPRTHRAMTGELSRTSGARVLSIDYRLAPEHPFPAALDDCVFAYQSLVESGYDPKRIAIAGDSAGGSLTGTTLLALKERGLPLPGCAAMLSPSTDMSFSAESWRTRKAIDPMLGNFDVTDEAVANNPYLAGQHPRNPLASPLFGDLKGLPPILLHVGTNERLVDDATRFDAAARAAGVPITFKIWNGQVHVFQMFQSMLPEAREAIAEIGAFIRAHTGGGGEAPAPSAESRKLFEAMQRQPRPSAAPTLEQMRASMEAFSRGPDADVTVSAVSANGIPCEWVAGPSPDPWRVVLYLHGGGYVMGSLNTHRQLAGWISKAAGARVLNVDYRLAPEHRYPAAVDDAVAAYEWLLSQGVAPPGIVVGGDSAGGGLTAATLLAIRNRRLPMPAGGVLLSPWTDLTGSSESLGTRGVLQPGGAGGTGLSDMAKQYVGSADPRDPLASPVYADLAGLPPLLIQVGTDEGLFDDSIRLDAAARTAAVEVEIEAYNGQGHVFQALAWSVPEAKQAISRIGEWVRAHTAQS